MVMAITLMNLMRVLVLGVVAVLGQMTLLHIG